VAKLRDELLVELEDSHQLSYEEPRVKLANIACNEVRYSASRISFRGQQLVHCLLHWISGAKYHRLVHQGWTGLQPVCDLYFRSVDKLDIIRTG